MGRKRKSGRPVHGWVLVDKPRGWTSTQVVGKVRWHLNARKAGHGGTLDPIATGLLPIALGEATKMVSHALHGEKAYRFTVRWGEARDTDDAEGEVTARSDRRPGRAEIEARLPAFTGTLSQIPPKYSAIKIAGERAYDLARDGEAVELESRPVDIHEFSLVEIPDADHAVFEVACGPGTYIRALARDLGLALGTYGHVAELRRTAVGAMRVGDAIGLDDFLAMTQGEADTRAVKGVAAALDDIPALSLTPDEARRLRNGQALSFIKRPDQARLAELGLDHLDQEVAALALAGDQPVAMVAISGPEIRPVRVLNL